jgi:hypothetical protein
MPDKVPLPTIALLKTIESIWSAVPVPADDQMAVAVAALGRGPLREWAIDLDSRLTEVQQGLNQADQRGLPEGLPDAENALWRLSAARKSLLALCFLTLGVPTMEPGLIHKGGRPVKSAIKTSVQWELHADLLDRRLKELSAKQPVAGELNGLLIELAEHDAITLRDEVTHSLAPIKSAPPLCVFVLWGVDGDRLLVPRELKFLWPRGMNDKPGITAKELWPDALAEIRDALGILLRATEKLTELIQQVGIEREPQRFFQNLDTGEVTTSDPRGRDTKEQHL